MQIGSNEDNLHETADLKMYIGPKMKRRNLFSEKQNKPIYFKMSSAENFTRNAKH